MPQLIPVTDPSVLAQLNGAVPGQAQPQGIGQRFGGALQRGLGSVGGALFPADPNMPPEAAQAAQNQALLSFGLGLMAAGNRPGATFGSAFGDAYQGASQGYQGAMQNAYQRSMQQKDMERQERQDASALERQKVADSRYESERKYQTEQDAIKQRNYEATQKAAAQDRAAQREQQNRPQYQVVQQPMPDGTVQPMLIDTRSGEQKPFGAAYKKPPTAKAPTEGDKKASVLIQGMADSERELAKITSTNTADVVQGAVGAIPLIGKAMQADEFKQYKAAAERWAANYLYLKSGAQAGQQEIQSTVQQFFPQPGEGAEVAEMKKRQRDQEMASITSVYGSGQSAGGWSAREM